MEDQTTLIYRLAWAIYCDLKEIERDELCFIPWWVSDLNLAKEYSPDSAGVDFRKWIWFRRAGILNEANYHSRKMGD